MTGGVKKIVVGPTHSAELDIDALLAQHPEARRQADITAAAIEAGELVRRKRAALGITQAELARRVGSVQPHISELERGQGLNGPTLATLARLFSELGDSVVVDTASNVAAKEQAFRDELEAQAKAFKENAGAREKELRDWINSIATKLTKTSAAWQAQSAIAAMKVRGDPVKSDIKLMLQSAFEAGVHSVDTKRGESSTKRLWTITPAGIGISSAPALRGRSEPMTAMVVISLSEISGSCKVSKEHVGLEVNAKDCSWPHVKITKALVGKDFRQIVEGSPSCVVLSETAHVTFDTSSAPLIAGRSTADDKEYNARLHFEY
jgi:transcriptional regulator with XRE-family HTH domain